MAYIDTGLGWYLDEDYLLTLGSVTIGTIQTSGGGDLRPITSIPYNMGYSGVNLTRLSPIGNNAWAFWGRVNSEFWTPAVITKGTITNIAGKGINGFAPNFLVSGDYALHVWYSDSGHNALPAGWPSIVSTSWNNIFQTAINDVGSVTKTISKVQGGAGAFAIVSYPHNGDTVYVGVGISSIPIPNSAATVAVDGTNGNHNTFNREAMQFTMFYTEQLTGTLTANVPVVALDADISGLPGVYEPRLFLAVADAAQIHVGEYDPYSGAGESEPGAENATFDFDSTNIDFGTPPTITAAGMVELYIPSTSDLASLAQYLWAGSFDPDNFKKLFADPMDAIIGLQIVPVTATEIGTTPDTLYVGNISTGLSMPKASRQYVPVDCGSLSIPRRLGSYLDYSPHTEMQLYLPYIGFVDISPDDCMGGTISVKYLVDIIGGTCVAQVKCNDHVLYEYAAACSCQVPVSAGQYQNIVLGSVRGAVGLVSGILGAAGGGLLSGLSEAADAALSMTKPKIQRSGGFGGSSGLMGHQTPYIIYTVPRLIVPGRQNNFIGYPSYITRTLGDLTGYTQIDSIHLSGIPASQSEQAEIEQLLQEGVYL